MTVWNNIHEHYAKQSWASKPSLFVQEVFQYFPQGASVLELGGGLGQDSVFFASHGCTVLLTDVSADVVAEAATTHGLATQQLDMSQPFPFEDASFDVVYAHLSLHYFDTATTHAIMAEIRRVLKTGGVLAVLVNTVEDPEYGAGREIEKDFFEIDLVNKRFFTPDSFAVFVTGFETVLLDAQGETYKDSAKGIHNLVRFVGKKV